MSDNVTDLEKKLLRFAAIGFIALIALLVLVGAIKKHSYEKTIIELQNQVAKNSATVEVQKDLYSKATVQVSDLKSLLDSKDVQIKELENQSKKDKTTILTATTAVASWKKAYEGLASATETTLPPTQGGASRDKVTFTKDFGYIGVNGYTLTNPAEAWVHVQQNRPLKLTLAVAQGKDKSWKTYVTSSEDNVSVDVSVAGVNPYILEPKWYEFLELNGQLGVGDGILAGVGAGMKLGKFTVGPNIWVTVDSKVSKFYGASLSWRPFERN